MRSLWKLALAMVAAGCGTTQAPITCNNTNDCARYQPGAYCSNGLCYAQDDGGTDGGLDGGAECQSSAGCTNDALPICDSQTHQCRTCSTGDDTACAMHKSNTPRCGGNGLCVACRTDTQASDCTTATAPVCDAASNACRGCRQHSECDSGVCKSDGSCLDAASIAYVDNGKVGCSDTAHVSTRNLPYCEIQAAVMSGGLAYVVVAGSSSSYGPVSVPSGTITIVGPGGSAATTAKIVPTAGPGVSVLTGTTAADVTVDGFDITSAGTAQSAVKCAFGVGTAALTVRNSLIHYATGVGVDATSCTIVVDSNIIAANQGGGLSFASNSLYTVTNNIIAANGSALANAPGVIFSNGATGTFAFNTVVKNIVAAGVGGIDCGSGAAKSIQNSIVWGNTTASGTQLAAQCTLANVVTVAGDDTRGTLVSTQPTWKSVTDFHLQPATAANLACCIDKITSDPGTPNKDHDVDNSARPKGAGWDIGAHEVQ